jgi:hypothetical protein
MLPYKLIALFPTYDPPIAPLLPRQPPRFATAVTFIKTAFAVQSFGYGIRKRFRKSLAFA